jgi:hypothetical protein
VPGTSVAVPGTTPWVAGAIGLKTRGANVDAVVMRNRLATTFAVAALAVAASGATVAGAQDHQPGTPQAVAAKVCKRGVSISTPGGEKCLQAGEFCSHASGYASAYRHAGFVCTSSGRLKRR